MSELEEQYRARHSKFLTPVSETLQEFLATQLKDCERIDRISTRAKSIARFLEKAMKHENGGLKYTDPMRQIQDQIGARVVTFYPSDVPQIASVVTKYFRPIESQAIIPDGEAEFGYVGQHFVLLLPSDATAGLDVSGNVPEFFELQIKTLFQHAWAEAEHDLGYKPSKKLDSLQKRKIAFTAAQAWGADQIFDELFRELDTTGR
jgi:putative GTP pyrophosphokinase